MVAMPKFGSQHAARQHSEKDFYHEDLGKWQVKKATSRRKVAIIASSVCLVLALVFLILVEIGNLNTKPVIRDTHFLTMNLTNVISSTVPNSILLNSIARTIGVHDFYTVGLWNFCEGYNNEGITYCSPHQARYYFNPVQILEDELLQGYSIPLPDDLDYALNLIKKASKWMFVFYLVGCCLTFVLIFFVFVSLYSRWWSFVVAIITLINAAFVAVASAIAQAMFTIIKNKLQDAIDVLNIRSELGNTIFAFTWTATAFTVIAFVIQFCLICCGASRRDVKTGRRSGNHKAYEES